MRVAKIRFFSLQGSFYITCWLPKDMQFFYCMHLHLNTVSNSTLSVSLDPKNSYVK